MNNQVNQWLNELTIEEKAELCSGKDFWTTQAVERLGIPSIMMTDGPHGLRKQAGESDHLGLNESVPATCFPSAVGLASTWNRDLIYDVGVALGKEARKEGVSVLLGPGANIKRSPLCGRNFEYFSEDPYVSAQLAAAHIKGVQSEGVGASLKHFAVNNQEHRRMSVDAIVDERTLREIYLASFEGAVKEAQPWTVMCSYNLVNGEYASEHKRLLTTILRDEWGFDGLVVSDWGAVNERAAGVGAGMDLEMPTSNGVGTQKILDAIEKGELDEQALDRAVTRILDLVIKSTSQKDLTDVDMDAQHQLARKVAREAVVLLKNESQLLPLEKSQRVAVLGELAKKPRYQGGGSSHINPYQLDHAYDELARFADSVSYAQGYDLEKDKVDDQLIHEATECARNSEVAVLFVGLPDRYESEGFDRNHMSLPTNHEALIRSVLDAQPNTIVILSNGSPVEMPWVDDVPAIIEGYLGGQAGGGAVADILYGVESPSGKLAETFPVRVEDNPSYLYFPGEGDRVEYREGIFVGYRYYDTKKVKPLFPFGHGLSYTTFSYENMTVSSRELNESDKVTVTIQIKNTGSVKGKEIVQLYVHDKHSSVVRPEKELKAFDKVELEPGETKEVHLELDRRAFAYYNTDKEDWSVESGEFELRVGPSSADIALTETISITSSEPTTFEVTRNSTIGDLMQSEHAEKLNQFLESHFSDSPFTPDEESEGKSEEGGSDMMSEMLKYMPLRALVNFQPSKEANEALEQFIKECNQSE
ncbi:glycoside hydrolase family 3 C-terminal domain-containing protein [Alkalicoccobacillus gibsonii]|uniref:glycoside hydrolase family 3 C-terminal domain-containing protein n=1 Tax=Alkalicoccobacillus gibsonii TaxID=79881 RepID=UPI001931E26A|nr:glycoside hydrolase family 3 C-terminal domain-containing protein [Alkalicoccobacillus gibsonii]MBM0065542.1 glycoside hydrolase family 3 C-terminal domain-containing protein [Alkalicoccobacillus gibsonii]